MTDLLVTQEATDDRPISLLEGVKMSGVVNVSDEQAAANIRHSIRLGYPQIRVQEIQRDRVCVVGGGPSLADTERELIDLAFSGAKVITMNGSYQWCLDRNIRPSAHIVCDARQSNARFIGPPVPQCRYLLASQCHPDTWAAVAGRPDVWIWHSMAPSNALAQILDAYYCKRWYPVIGGITVATRTIGLLRALGFLRMDFFGVDSCWMGGHHHAFPQPENDADKVFPFRVAPVDQPELGRTFWCSTWHLQQFDDLLQMIRLHGEKFLLNVHGDGLLAYALKTSAALSVTPLKE